MNASLVGSSGWLGSDDFNKFKSLCATSKLRAGSKQTIDTADESAAEWPVTTLHTVEIKTPGSRHYLPLKMPDGGWFFDDYKDRDRVLAALTC